MSNNLSHSDLCLATAKRFIDKVALWEYQSFYSLDEQPDVLIYGEKKTILFEIKMSMADFTADKYKFCRKKYTVPHWAHWIGDNQMTEDGEYKNKKLVLRHGAVEINLIEKAHLGNRRYFVCPADVIPVNKVPEGWGLYYYKNDKFYKKIESGIFRPNLRVENALIVHALRRFASGDTTGIMVNTYEIKGKRKVTL
jgi:hypothetical protein